MSRFAPLALLLVFASLSVPGSSSPAPEIPSREPENHALVVDRMIRYHDYGEYDLEIRNIANAARDYLATVTPNSPNEKLAAVFDIDETTLSNYEAMAACGFCAFSVQIKLHPTDDKDPAILPVLELYNYAKHRHIEVFFLTGRAEAQRELTERNLTAAGYSGWSGLIMRAPGNTDPASIYKSRERQNLTSKGYRIVLNVGDQASDLAGCCAERVYKLPNPFYMLK